MPTDPSKIFRYFKPFYFPLTDIEFDECGGRTREEIDLKRASFNMDFYYNIPQASYVGTLYPFEMNFATLVKLFWKLDYIEFTCQDTTIYTFLDANTNTEYTRTETMRLENNKISPNYTLDSNVPALNPLTTMQTLKVRAAQPYKLGYTRSSINFVNNNETTLTEDIDAQWLDGEVVLEQPKEDNIEITQIKYAPRVVAKYNSGDKTDLNSYTYYPMFYFNLKNYYETLSTYTAGNLSLSSRVQNQYNVDVKLNNVSLGTIKLYRVKNNSTAMWTNVQTESTISDLTFHLWDPIPEE